MKEWPSGSHMVMKTTTANDVDLYLIGYKYNKKSVNVFIFTENAGTMVESVDDPYIANFIDSDGVAQTRKIERPDIVAKYYGVSNVIDIINQYRQGNLELEVYWATRGR